MYSATRLACATTLPDGDAACAPLETRRFDRSEPIPCFGVLRCVGLCFAFLDVLILTAAFREALMRYAFACQAARKQSR
jgi:hypothetical protein